jgi:hypothetical protein
MIKKDHHRTLAGIRIPSQTRRNPKATQREATWKQRADKVLNPFQINILYEINGAKPGERPRGGCLRESDVHFPRKPSGFLIISKTQTKDPGSMDRHNKKRKGESRPFAGAGRFFQHNGEGRNRLMQCLRFTFRG